MEIQILLNMFHNYQMIQKRNMISVNGINIMIILIPFRTLHHYNIIHLIIQIINHYMKQPIINQENLGHQHIILLLMIIKLVINNFMNLD